MELMLLSFAHLMVVQETSELIMLKECNDGSV